MATVTYNHRFSNWAGSYQCRPAKYFEPATVKEIGDVLKMTKSENLKVKVVGAGHSPSDICCTEDIMISLKKFNKVLAIDKGSMTFTAQSGATVRDIVDILKAEGLALPCLPTILDLTIGGMIATATHSSGIHYKVLSAYVEQLELMSIDGSVMRLSRAENLDIFKAACVHLGAFGPIISVTMACVPHYNLLTIRSAENFTVAMDNIDKYVEESDHFRMYLYPYVDKVVLDRVDRKSPSSSTINSRQESFLWDRLIGYHLLQLLYFLAYLFPPLVAPINRLYFKLFCLHPQTVSDSYEKVFSFDCLFSQFVMEWAIPKCHTATVLRELKSYIEANRLAAHFPIEVRFAGPDDLYSSPAYGRETTYINVVSYRPYGVEVPFQQYWKAFEAIAKRYEGRPHLAKDHHFQYDQMVASFPQFSNFCRVRKQLDPDNMYQNDYVTRLCN